MQASVSTPSPSLELARAYARAGDLRQAEMVCCQILQDDVQNADALHLLGQVAHRMGRYHFALICLGKAIALQPLEPRLHHLLGQVYRDLGRLDDAISCYQQAIRLAPQEADPYADLGVALQLRGRSPEAVASYHRALQLRPGWAEVYVNLAVALRAQGQLAEAAAHLRHAMQLAPDNPMIYNNLGVVCQLQGQLDVASSHYRQAIAIDPTYVKAYNNLGTVLRLQDRLEEATAALQQALALDPEYADAYSNLGLVLQDQGRLDEALWCFEQALQRREDHVEAHWNRALLWLAVGNYAQGWPEYEWRWRRSVSPPPPLRQPRWDGSPLHGQTIFVYAEQGLGDTLQFVRYLPLVAALGGRILFACQPPLARLLQRLPAIAHLIVANGIPVPEEPFDVHAPLLSLPGLLHTTEATIPAAVPYLTPDPELVEKWRPHLAPLPGYKVGLVWAGNARHPNDRRRSCTLAQLAPLAQVPGVTLVSLQKGPAAQQVALLSALPLVDYSHELHDFADTAALVAHLDLVISVDTAVAHLAGAMGKPVWTLLPFSPDWRWQWHRPQTPWYPTMRLFRQPRPGDWPAVVQQVVAALATQVRARHG
ncbi:MAG: hypothetical protein KatS3mg131_1302 [Candidatus Tectimicrobiota bacterium]|nr:MAG: hypothetical protein KatS3mg131_1302 [Candidatus Tectomicrobia bacterium]